MLDNCCTGAKVLRPVVVAEESSHSSVGGLGSWLVRVVPSRQLFCNRNSPRPFYVLNPVADRRYDACRREAAGCLFRLRSTMKLAKHLRLTTVFDHLQRPHIVFAR